MLQGLSHLRVEKAVEQRHREALNTEEECLEDLKEMTLQAFVGSRDDN
jgi:hypothetical protein